MAQRASQTKVSTWTPLRKLKKFPSGRDIPNALLKTTWIHVLVVQTSTIISNQLMSVMQIDKQTSIYGNATFG